MAAVTQGGGKRIGLVDGLGKRETGLGVWGEQPRPLRLFKDCKGDGLQTKRPGYRRVNGQVSRATAPSD